MSGSNTRYEREGLKEEVLSLMREEFSKGAMHISVFDDRLLEIAAEQLLMRRLLEKAIRDKAELSDPRGLAALVRAWNETTRTLLKVFDSLVVSRLARLRFKGEEETREQIADLIRRVYKRLEEIERRSMERAARDEGLGGEDQVD